MFNGRPGLRRSPSKMKVNELPFPTRQLFILALCRICEPIAFMSIFPYIYYMVKSFKITDDEHQIAMYAGMVISAFAMAEFLASIFWGRLSDRVGRKPILLTGLAGTGLSMVMFGFAPTLPIALVARALGGILNGNIAVLQTTVAEVVTVEAHRPRAFSIMPFVWCLGSIIGAGLGGALAEPVTNYPAVFQRGGIFDKFPYLLPNLVCAAFVVIGLLIGILFLEESHEDKKDRRDVGLELGKWLLQILRFRDSETKSSLDESEMFLSEEEKHFALNSIDSSPRLSTVSTSVSEVEVYTPKSSLVGQRRTFTWRETFSNQVLLIILGLGILAFHTIAFEQLLPVLFSMPESETIPELPFKFVGGFALSTKSIGVILSTQGFLQMFAQVFVFPVVVKKLGALKTFRCVIFGYPILYFLVPYLSLVPHLFRFPAILLVLLWKVTAQSLSYPSTSLMLVAAAPSKRTLGTLNGLGQSSACLARTIGPLLAGSVQAAGLRLGYSGLSWWFCAAIAIFGAIVSCWQQEQAKGTSMESSMTPSVIDFSDEENLVGEPMLEPSQDDELRQSTSTLIDCMADISKEQDKEIAQKLSTL